MTCIQVRGSENKYDIKLADFKITPSVRKRNKEHRVTKKKGLLWVGW